MKKAKIVFKNGEKQVVSYEVMKKIKESLTNGTLNWMTFSNTKNEPFLIINLPEIAFIIDLDYKADDL